MNARCSSNISSDNLSSFELIFAFWQKVSERRKFQIKALIILMLLNGVCEIISIGSVVPFLSVLVNSKNLWEKSYIKELSLNFGIQNHFGLILPMTLIFIFSVFISAFIKLLNIWSTGRLSASIGSDFSCSAFERTLYQPYSVHISRNSSDLIASISIQIKTCLAILESVLNMISALVVLLSILFVLIIIDWKVAFIIFSVFGIVYIFIRFIARKRLDINGKKIDQFTKNQVKYLSEGIGAIREVLLSGNQKNYIKVYREKDLKLWQLGAQNNLISISPRYILEAFGLLIIASVSYGLVQLNNQNTEVLPILGAIALGAQRLLPTSQIIYSSWAVLRGNKSALYSVLSLLNQPIPKEIKFKQFSKLKFNSEIIFKDVSFKYSQNNKRVINKISFKIKKGERIGIIGKTGSGKSTLVDILIGLLYPTAGSVFVDNTKLDFENNFKDIINWRMNIAHVPQSIYLSDSSIAQNIAFGIPKENVDFNLVRDAARKAQIDSFIEQMPKGYQTYVGERGIKLSGGQRQRIAVARALYREAKLLVFDEATSALDNNTEQAIMNSIENLSSELTIILIAHRLSTVKNCDRIFELNDGELIKIYKKNELAEKFFT